MVSRPEHHGHRRQILIGPRAQDVLRPFLVRPDDAYVFSPANAEAQRNARRRASRTTPRWPSHDPDRRRQRRRGKRPRKRPPSHQFTSDSYRRAIRRAIEQAYPPLGDLAQRDDETKRKWRERVGKRWSEVEAWWKAHGWHPHQLRHNAATSIRKEFGLEAARVVLGVRSVAVADIYAEVDRSVAMDVMEKVG